MADWTDSIQLALRRPGGARFYRCALQVNPYEYLVRHAKETSFQDEDAYNQAVVDACRQQGIEVIAVTDHYRVKSAVGLNEAAREAGLHVLPGFEAVTKDGVHLLCLFDEGKTVEALERVLGACGITEDVDESPTGALDAIEFLEKSRTWGAVCVAAHVASPGGLLRALTGHARVNAWKSDNLLACSLPGPIGEAPENLRRILQNRDANYRRAHPVAVINAKDVNGPDDLAIPGASCWIKMSEVSVEGLRQAFLDPESRIRLSSDPAPDEHVEFVAMAWEGGFLDGQSLRFNENLNVLVGGRGTGKSTVVESIRYVLGLDPAGDEARKAHQGMVQNVLRAGTKVSLLVRSHRPVLREYLIERTVPNPPVVRDQSGKVLDLAPEDIVPQAEVYGQHEISELTRSPQKLIRLLDRFVQHDSDLEARKAQLIRDLGESRTQLLQVRRDLEGIEDQLAALPRLEERLVQFQEAGVEERLKEQSVLVTEEQVLRTAANRVGAFDGILEQLQSALPIDQSFLSAESLSELPSRAILSRVNDVLKRLEEDLRRVLEEARDAVGRARQGIAGVERSWEERRRSVEAELQTILRELQATGLDGAHFMELRRQIESLRPLRERRAELHRRLAELEALRRQQLIEWEDVKTKQFRLLDGAARRVSRQLQGRVQVQVTFAGDREPLTQLLREGIGGRLSEAIEALKARDSLSLKELGDAWRAGPQALAEKFGIPMTQAERLAKAPSDVIMRIEELDLPPIAQIELNLSPDSGAAAWQALDDLSTGQKATAVLLLLLLESDAPLVVDQPEDDLDNRFIMEGIVPKMREEKRRRQFIFSTHNANIPVLGDAELIIGLRASGKPGRGRGEIPEDQMGSIDSAPVRTLVQEILEGGRDAFEMRRLKYGF